MIINTCEKEQEIAKRRQQREDKMTNEEKALEEVFTECFLLNYSKH